ncbi:MAG: hypothetical protein JF616_13965 [Fibrobacteres bacterium]|nr:hypothetical protein [Fibrobacterota bacterium]
MRTFFSTALLALGMAGLIRAADTAPAASTAPAVTTPAATTPTAAGAATAATPASAAPAAASATPAPSPVPTKAKPDSAKAKPAKKLSKRAKAAADSTARADSLKAAASADSLKAAQAKASADSVRAAEIKAAADSVRADSARKAEARAKAVADSSRIAASADSIAADSAAAKSKKRKRIVRETTVNTIDELKGKYRSPKKAMFMSLIVPGLGQAYVGHNWFNYTRGATYFLTDVALAYGWHYYVRTRQDREISKYQAFADRNWRQAKYEDSVNAYKEKSATLNLHRESYCDFVQSTDTEKGKLLHGGCLDPKSSEYPSFKNEYDDSKDSADVVARLRAAFPNAQQFYELIGKENEFITGWNDAPAMKTDDSAWFAVDKDGNATKELATTPNQQAYIAMRAQANDYARMQAWFLGGMVLNHIVSAVDAAITARYHNKALYQTETSWYDKLHLDSRIAWDGLAPVPSVTASLTF